MIFSIQYKNLKKNLDLMHPKSLNRMLEYLLYTIKGLVVNK